MMDPESLFARLEADHGRGRPPVDRWNPAHVGDSAMRIAVDGRWFYRESEIKRPEMVRLFSSILRRDGDAYFLVTPVERLAIRVEDAPFVAVDFEARGEGADQRLVFLTNVDDVVQADRERPVSVRNTPAGPRPYVLVRDALPALISRPVYYRLVELSVADPSGRQGVWSAGTFFALDASA